MEELAADIAVGMSDTRAVLGAVETQKNRWDKQEARRVSMCLVRRLCSLIPAAAQAMRMPLQPCFLCVERAFLQSKLPHWSCT